HPRLAEDRDEQPTRGIEGEIAHLGPPVAALDWNEGPGAVVGAEIAATGIDVEGNPLVGSLQTDRVCTDSTELVRRKVPEWGEGRAAIVGAEQPGSCGGIQHGTVQRIESEIAEEPVKHAFEGRASIDRAVSHVRSHEH